MTDSRNNVPFSRRGAAGADADGSGSRSAEFARALRARGLGVVLVEYRGYGAARGGSPTEEGLYLDAESALDMLAARGIGAERVVLSGVSLGTGVAAEMARRGRGGRGISGRGTGGTAYHLGVIGRVCEIVFQRLKAV